MRALQTTRESGLDSLNLSTSPKIPTFTKTAGKLETDPTQQGGRPGRNRRFAVALDAYLSYHSPD